MYVGNACYMHEKQKHRLHIQMLALLIGRKCSNTRYINSEPADASYLNRKPPIVQTEPESKSAGILHDISNCCGRHSTDMRSIAMLNADRLINMGRCSQGDYAFLHSPGAAEKIAS